MSYNKTIVSCDSTAVSWSSTLVLQQCTGILEQSNRPRYLQCHEGSFIVQQLFTVYYYCVTLIIITNDQYEACLVWNRAVFFWGRPCHSYHPITLDAIFCIIQYLINFSLSQSFSASYASNFPLITSHSFLVILGDTLKVLSSEIDPAEISLIRNAFIKKRGAEVFRTSRPSPISVRAL